MLNTEFINGLAPSSQGLFGNDKLEGFGWFKKRDNSATADLFFKAAKYFSVLKFSSGNDVKDWFNASQWQLKGTYIESKGTPFKTAKKLMGGNISAKWQSDCLNFLYFCHLYVLYNQLINDPDKFDALFPSGLKLGLPSPKVNGRFVKRTFSCNWIQQKLYLGRGVVRRISRSGYVEKMTYVKDYDRFYIGDGYDEEDLVSYGFSPLYDEDDDAYTTEKEILKKITPGCRLAFTCLAASPYTEYKNENMIYLGGAKYAAIPYSTDSKTKLSLRQIKKEYAETCIANLKVEYKNRPYLAKSPYIDNLRKFMKNEILITAFEIIEPRSEKIKL